MIKDPEFKVKEQSSTFSLLSRFINVLVGGQRLVSATAFEKFVIN